MKKDLVLATLTLTLTLAFLAPAVTHGAEKPKAKPYPLKKCIVSDEELGADASMQPYVFIHEGREIKLCCKSCLKDFKKDSAKYMAKIEAAEKKSK